MWYQNWSNGLPILIYEYLRAAIVCIVVSTKIGSPYSLFQCFYGFIFKRRSDALFYKVLIDAQTVQATCSCWSRAEKHISWLILQYFQIKTEFPFINLILKACEWYCWDYWFLLPWARCHGWMCFWATWSSRGCPYSLHGVGVVDFWRSPPTKTILRFYDFQC